MECKANLGNVQLQSQLPKITVIIPTYNRAHVIKRALMSVLTQSFTDFEVIIVDDASSDHTEAVINSINDSRVRYVRHDKQRGACAARNTGIKSALAEFIAFQDSDDEWLCEKLAKQMAVFEHANENIGVIYSGFLRFKDKNATYYPSTLNGKVLEGDILHSLLEGNFVGLPTVIVRRKYLLSLGMFDESLPRFQDWEMFIRISRKYKFAYIDEPLVIAFHSKESISADGSLIYDALKLIIDKHGDIYAGNKRALARNYYDLGGAACMSNKMVEGLRYFLNSLTLNPLHLMCWIRIFTGLFGPQFYQMVSRWIARTIVKKT